MAVQPDQVEDGVRQHPFDRVGGMVADGDAVAALRDVQAVEARRDRVLLPVGLRPGVDRVRSVGRELELGQLAHQLRAGANITQRRTVRAKGVIAEIVQRLAGTTPKVLLPGVSQRSRISAWPEAS